MAAGDSVGTSHMDAMSRALDPDQGRAGPFASNSSKATARMPSRFPSHF